MNNSMTSETDAMIAADQHHLEDDSFFPATVYWRMCDLARALERDSQEWRKKAVDLHKRLAAERALADRLANALSLALGEHDGPNDAYDTWEEARK